jgi:hypothetical protein
MANPSGKMDIDLFFVDRLENCRPMELVRMLWAEPERKAFAIVGELEEPRTRRVIVLDDRELWPARVDPERLVLRLRANYRIAVEKDADYVGTKHHDFENVGALILSMIDGEARKFLRVRRTMTKQMLFDLSTGKIANEVGSVSVAFASWSVWLQDTNGSAIGNTPIFRRQIAIEETARLISQSA